MFCKKGVLRNFTKFTGKHLCQSLFFNKVAGLRPKSWHRCFPVNFVKFLRTYFFTEHVWWLLLYLDVQMMEISWKLSSQNYFPENEKNNVYLVEMQSFKVSTSAQNLYCQRKNNFICMLWDELLEAISGMDKMFLLKRVNASQEA